MWTPRRLILVISSILLFGGGFTAYSQLFGWIDGLPPLPQQYTHAAVETTDIPQLREGVTPLQARIRTAFGPNCIEQSYNLKFESREKGLLFAAAEGKILEDGRVLFQQISVAVFGKGTPEITTVHADRAFLTFETPVRKLDDIGNKKVTAAVLHADPDFLTNDPRKGKIHIINNRKTADPIDDLIFRTPGPLYYVDEPKPAQPHIWTFNSIELFDRQNRPLPSQPESQYEVATVTGEGMRVYLTIEPKTGPGAPPKKAAKPANTSAINGVERVELDHDVLMNIWTESRNMFGGDAGKTPPPKQPVVGPLAPPPPPLPPAEKVLLVIQSNGPFYYDMIKDFAHFEVPPQRDPNIQEYVKVTRKTKANSEDTLTSDFLDVQFLRRRGTALAQTAGALGIAGVPLQTVVAKVGTTEKGSSSEGSLEIETIHAWGKNIALSSDDNGLFAYGFDLVHDAGLNKTVLKGAPMHAVKNGNLIRAPELMLVNLDDKEKQNIRARGPGIIGMGDFDPNTQEHSRQAHWQDMLVVTKVKEHGQELDLIELSGGARFMDSINDQRLSARELRLWMIAKEEKPETKQSPKKAVVKVDPKKSTPIAKKNAEEDKQLPRRLEAIREVMLYSPDLIIHKSDYLNVWFKDVPPPPFRPPEKLPDPRDASVVGKGPIDPKTPLDPMAKFDPLAKKEEPTKKEPPMIVRQSRRIEAWVNRLDGKNELDKVYCKGNVIIHQDPSPGNQKGVDVAGHTVDLESHLEGSQLIVCGNEQTLGEVHFDTISIIADDIKIDQRDNTANVKGPGSMRLLTKSGLTDGGKPLDKPDYIDIFWNDSMELDGPIKSVRYEGNVQAKQRDGKVLCQTMQVWLDRPLLLNQASRAKEPAPKIGKDGKKEDNSPKVEKVLCDQVPSDNEKKKPMKLVPVFVEDVKKEGGKLIEYQNIQGTQVDMDNAQGKMTAIGPGTVRLFQAGAKDPVADRPMPDPKAPSKKGNDEEMKLTWVQFDRRMIAYQNVPKRAVFYNNVEVVHMPSNTHEVNINIAKLPDEAVYIKCEERLEITTQSRKAVDKNGKEIEIKWQEMKAEGNVKVRSADYDGWSGTLTYTEEKSLLVFTGTPRNPAVLRRAEIKGGPRNTFSGQKITYNVKTKDVNVEESNGGSN